MKLIKQNDSAGGLIFKQNTDGKAMKQNYNFGKAWNSANSGGAYIEIAKTINPNDVFTIGFFEKKITRTNTAANAYIQSSNSYLDFSFYVNVNTISYFRYNDIVYQNVYNKFLPAAIFNGTNFQYYSSSNGIVTTTQASLDNSIPSILIRSVGPGNRTRVNGLFIYDRALSVEELDYRRNSGLGNDLLNVTQLWGEFPLNGAEILNTGGADFVGVRDISGNNRHQPILGLPAGTLEEQKEWANINCFEQF